MTGITGWHPALTGGSDPVPSLTLVLPPGLGTDQAARGIVAAVEQARASLTRRALHYQQRAEHAAIAGDHLSQALCRGQALASKHAVGTLDEAIMEVFGLWPQYERQMRPWLRKYRPPRTWTIRAMTRGLRVLAGRAVRAGGRR
jgi:hypothetical protein